LAANILLGALIPCGAAHIPRGTPCGYSLEEGRCETCGYVFRPQRESSSLHWYHIHCYDILRLSVSRTSAFIPGHKEISRFHKSIGNPELPDPNNTVHPNYVLMEEGLFSPHSKSVLDTCFSQNLLSRLPPEVFTIIIGHLGVCHYLILLGKTCRLISHTERLRKLRYKIPDVIISKGWSKPIHVSRIFFNGRDYISTISSESLPPWASSPEMPVPEVHGPPGASQLIVLSSDGGVVRKLQVLNEDQDVPSTNPYPAHQITQLRRITGDRNLKVEHSVRFAKRRGRRIRLKNALLKHLGALSSRLRH
jgi:hypothetical protein